MTQKNKKPWPTKAVMKQIYEKHLWGGRNIKFYSGDGSHKPEIVTPYLNVIKTFLTSFKNPITVCDLGCGDFNIGKELVPYTSYYHAIDIVPELIDYHKKNVTAKHLQFYCLDISKDHLPDADCVIIRQVLQHLSNNEVQSIVKKLFKYKYVILTEHIPKGDFIANKDIISGQRIRLKKQSGLNLLDAPFSLPVKSKKELLRYHVNDKEVILTLLFEL